MLFTSAFRFWFQIIFQILASFVPGLRYTTNLTIGYKLSSVRLQWLMQWLMQSSRGPVTHKCLVKKRYSTVEGTGYSTFIPYRRPCCLTVSQYRRKTVLQYRRKKYKTRSLQKRRINHSVGRSHTGVLVIVLYKLRVGNGNVLPFARPST